MKTETSINGYFELIVCILDTEIPVDEETSQGVFDDLELGEYVIGIRTRQSKRLYSYKRSRSQRCLGSN